MDIKKDNPGGDKLCVANKQNLKVLDGHVGLIGVFFRKSAL